MIQTQLPPLAINVPDLSPPDDDFTHLDIGQPLTWCRLSGLPSNALERLVPRIRVSRYRAAWQAGMACKPGALVISHLPMMTAAVQQVMSLARKSSPHLGFAFNFTDLPTGPKFNYMRSNFRQVDQFAVFSRHEQDLYANYFDLPRERFVPTLWTQDVPPLADVPAAQGHMEPFLCAIGGEGRDFALLLEAARRFAPVQLLVIARPTSLAGLSIPDNVKVLINQPLGVVWRWASRSCGVLMPLQRADTCCGHVTMVSAKLLGIPIATTITPATAEYVAGRQAILQCEAGDAAAFAHLSAKLIDERDRFAELAQDSAPTEQAFHNRRIWADYLRQFVATSLA